MFVYAIKISGPPQRADAFELLKSEFNVSQQAFDKAKLGEEPLIIAEPHRSGELFFDRELKVMGQSFTSLSRAGLRFEVLRKRHDDQYKVVANYTEFLKSGRKSWREEKLRVDAASESLESFLCQEANSEDMEVLRPLFPSDINKLLRDTDTGVMKGSSMLQEVFPTLKGADARRIFYQMQILFEKRAGKWKNRLGCAWVFVYFIMSVFIGIAIYDWLTESIDIHGFISAPIALILGLLPFAGSILAYISATSVWGWSAIVTFVIFFWYYLPIAYLIILLLLASFRGQGKVTWQKIIGNAKRDNDDDKED